LFEAFSNADAIHPLIVSCAIQFRFCGLLWPLVTFNCLHQWN